MRKTLFTIFSAILFATVATGQEEVYSSSGRPLNRSEKNVKSEKVVDPDRFIIGGWGVFGIGSGFTNVGVTPIFGYKITENFAAGIGFGYQYIHVKNYNSVIIDPNTGAEEFRSLNAHLYSPSIWARHIIWNNIFAQVEYEHNIANQRYFTNDFTKYNTLPIIKMKETLTVPCLLVGGGLRQPISDRTSLVLMILYDILQDKNSPYRNTIALRFGVNVGF